MLFHMKTTLNIPDDLMRQLKKKAATEKQTLSNVVADTLKRGLQPPERKTLHRLRTFRCGEAKVDVADREQLYRAMEGR